MRNGSPRNGSAISNTPEPRPCIGFAMSALLPSAAIVRAVRQIDLAPSGNVSNSFKAALIHEIGRVFRVIGRPLLPSIHIAMLSYLTTLVKWYRRPGVILSGCSRQRRAFAGAPYVMLCDGRGF